MDKQDSVLIVAASGRALAASARRGGFVPLVADFFGDQDTLALAHRHCVLPEASQPGCARTPCLPRSRGCREARVRIGVVCGTGFEDRPQLLATIAARWRLLGNSPGTVARLKDPLAFAALCGAAGIPHPPVSLQPPADPDGWLASVGGAGGSHIKAASRGNARQGTYVQRLVTGTPVSAFVLADGRRAQVLGSSAQWSAPTPHQPFRFGGAVAPAPVACATAERLAEVVARVMTQVPLVGLEQLRLPARRRSAVAVGDQPAAGRDPRPVRARGRLAVRAHVEACARRAASVRPGLVGGPRPQPSSMPTMTLPPFPLLDWPDWTADRPHPGTRIKGGEPLCTVISVAASADEAQRIVGRSADEILSLMVARAA